jgi:hypothetical protein
MATAEEQPSRSASLIRSIRYPYRKPLRTHHAFLPVFSYCPIVISLVFLPASHAVPTQFFKYLSNQIEKCIETTCESK